MAEAPEAFPLRDPFGVTVVFGKTKPDFEGYGPIDPIIEVLANVGMIEEEGLEVWERDLQDPNSGETYTVSIEPAASEDA
jgi:hypothetical protein